MKAKRGRKPNTLRNPGLDALDQTPEYGDAGYEAVKALDKNVRERLGAAIAADKSTATPEPQFEETATIAVPDEPMDKTPAPEPDCHNVTDNLTTKEFYRNIANEVQMSSVTKMENVKKFPKMHEGFQFPNQMPDPDKIRYMENVAHFKLFEVDQ